jgi:hypothetical protein
MNIVRVFDEAAETYDNVGVDFFTPIGAELVRAAGPRTNHPMFDSADALRAAVRAAEIKPPIALTTRLRIVLAGGAPVQPSVVR